MERWWEEGEGGKRNLIKTESTTHSFEFVQKNRWPNNKYNISNKVEKEKKEEKNDGKDTFIAFCIVLFVILYYILYALLHAYVENAKQ